MCIMLQIDQTLLRSYCDLNGLSKASIIASLEKSVQEEDENIGKPFPV